MDRMVSAEVDKDSQEGTTAQTKCITPRCPINRTVLEEEYSPAPDPPFIKVLRVFPQEQRPCMVVTLAISLLHLTATTTKNNLGMTCLKVLVLPAGNMETFKLELRSLLLEDEPVKCRMLEDQKSKRSHRMLLQPLWEAVHHLLKAESHRGCDCAVFCPRYQKASMSRVNLNLMEFGVRLEG